MPSSAAATSSSSSPWASSNKTSVHPDQLVGSKLRQQHMSSFREHVSAPTSEFAKKQLEKMGWSVGTGLGKKRNGITSHIKVKKRKDQLGLGGSDKPDVERVLGNSEWWKDSLGGTLARLGSSSSKSSKSKSKSKKKDKKKKEKDNKTDTKKHKQYTDEELFQATGGARFGMRAAPTRNVNKWIRTEKDESEEKTLHKRTLETEKAISVDISSTTCSVDDKKSKKRKLQNESVSETVQAEVSENISDEELVGDGKKESKKLRKEKKKKRKTILDPGEKDETATSTEDAKEKRKTKKVKKGKKRRTKSKESEE
jgi:Pin2-interacting protein X1